jgi:hypothetical protein
MDRKNTPKATKASTPERKLWDSHAKDLPKSPGGSEPRVLSNVVARANDGGVTLLYRNLASIVEELKQWTNNWPRRVNGQLFVPGDCDYRLLTNADQLFAWFYSMFEVRWITSEVADMTGMSPQTTPISSRQFYSHLAATTDPDYDSVENKPHEPALPNSFYHFASLPEPTGHALGEFGERLNADSPLDRDLLVAAAITPGWGGPPGTRPAFMLTSEYGPGSGKTETAELMCGMWGGALSINEAADWPTISKHIMNDRNVGRRCLLIDNIKKPFSHSGLESLITSPEIGGGVLYVGYRKRPNYFSVIMTANVPELSHDLTDRSVLVAMGPPRHGGEWKEWAVKFLATKKEAFVSDSIAVLTGPPVCKIDMELQDRWSPWINAVLTRFPNGNDMAAHIFEKRAAFDSEVKFAKNVAEVARNLAHQINKEDPDALQLNLDKRVLHDRMISAKHVHRNAKADSVNNRIRAALGMSPLRRCLSEPEEGGAWLWTGPDYKPPSAKGGGRGQAQ